MEVGGDFGKRVWGVAGRGVCCGGGVGVGRGFLGIWSWDRSALYRSLPSAPGLPRRPFGLLAMTGIFGGGGGVSGFLRKLKLGSECTLPGSAERIGILTVQAHARREYASG